MVNNTLDYNKKPLDTKDQIQLLLDRNLTIQNYDRCINFLNNVSYYKISGYWEHKKDEHTPDKFRNNSSLDEIITIYELDLEIKHLVLTLLSYYETALKN